MDDQNKNLILATALSFVVILIWFVLFPPPEPEATDLDAPVAEDVSTPVGDVAATPEAAPGATPATDEPAADSADDAARIAIETDRLSGSISTLGGRIDTLALKDYHVTPDESSPIVDLLRPVGNAGAVAENAAPA